MKLENVFTHGCRADSKLHSCLVLVFLLGPLAVTAHITSTATDLVTLSTDVGVVWGVHSGEQVAETDGVDVSGSHQIGVVHARESIRV